METIHHHSEIITQRSKVFLYNNVWDFLALSYNWLSKRHVFYYYILGLQRKGGDLEVCYINETILEEQSDEEEPEDSGTDQLNLEEENELYDDYHYEEDFWDHIKVIFWR